MFEFLLAQVHTYTMHKVNISEMFVRLLCVPNTCMLYVMDKINEHLRQHCDGQTFKN